MKESAMTAPVSDALDTSVLLKTLIAFKDGDFSVRLPVDQTGIAGKVADTLNDIFQLNERMTSEFARISSAVGKEGKINQRASMGSASSWWNKRSTSPGMAPSRSNCVSRLFQRRTISKTW